MAAGGAVNLYRRSNTEVARYGRRHRVQKWPNELIRHKYYWGGLGGVLCVGSFRAACIHQISKISLEEFVVRLLRTHCAATCYPE